MVRKTKILLLISVFVFLALLLWQIPAQAAEPERGKTIRVGYYENEVFQEGASESAVKVMPMSIIASFPNIPAGIMSMFMEALAIFMTCF